MDNAKYLNAIEEVIHRGPYRANWDSLSEYEIPAWFKNAKFGIFIHWGLYSVPAFRNEWYSRNMYIQGTPEYEHHIKTYGPHKDFGYKGFIPMFTAEKFDAKEWISAFKQAGAKYVVPVAEHHDGFQMYASGISHFNAAEMGPKRDIIGSLKAEAERQGIVFAVSSHRAEHQWFMGNGKDFESDIREPLKRGDFYWPSIQQQPDMQDIRSGPYPNEEYLEDWLLRTCELIDLYHPRLLYFDWWIQHEAYKEHVKQMAAYYYNRGAEYGFPVGICYKQESLAFGSGIVDVERGKFAQAKPYYWQTDTAIARNSWCYTDTLDYKSSNEVICYLCDVVSKNGNLLLNVGPKADGTLAEKDREILKEIGEWLTVNGEAVYGSRCWRFAEEGPTAEKEGQFSDGKENTYTSKDFRFTAAHGNIYAICMNYPQDGKITIRSLYREKDLNKPVFQGSIQRVSILGSEEKISYFRDEKGLHFQTQNVKSRYPVVIKIEVK
ncbi:MAG: alpha-L-fucosidase [Clostridiales bacterium]|nr:alpha-L-fucosidase [Clostridiales bacterium]